MVVNMREQMGERLLELAKRHRTFIATDPNLQLASRTYRQEAIRSFYGRVLTTLGLLKTAQAWYRLNVEAALTSPLEGREHEVYSLHDVFTASGIKENVVIFKVLECFGTEITQETLEDRVQFSVPAKTVQRIMHYLTNTGVLDYERFGRR